jgi:succinate dehydrogenase / fumarate reductase cytochrome b subunit
MLSKKGNSYTINLKAEETMKWLLNIIGTSIGKKLMMAVTGLSFCGFLALHLVGNLAVYAGKDAFNTYAERLHSLGLLITISEWGLLLFAIIHVLTGANLFYENLVARPIKYSVKKSAGGSSLGSATMPYTGFLLLLFIAFHLFNFHFADKSNQTIFQIVVNTFAMPGYVIIYVVAVLVAAIHISHGFWSAFQTIGANHPKYMPFVRGVSLVYSLIIGIGFGFIPLYILVVS